MCGTPENMVVCFYFFYFSQTWRLIKQKLSHVNNVTLTFIHTEYGDSYHGQKLDTQNVSKPFNCGWPLFEKYVQMSREGKQHTTGCVRVVRLHSFCYYSWDLHFVFLGLGVSWTRSSTPVEYLKTRSSQSTNWRSNFPRDKKPHRMNSYFLLSHSLSNRCRST